jgi:hypothetical protein
MNEHALFKAVLIRHSKQELGGTPTEYEAHKQLRALHRRRNNRSSTASKPEGPYVTSDPVRDFRSMLAVDISLDSVRFSSEPFYMSSGHE